MPEDNTFPLCPSRCLPRKTLGPGNRPRRAVAAGRRRLAVDRVGTSGGHGTRSRGMTASPGPDGQNGDKTLSRSLRGCQGQSPDGYLCAGESRRTPATAGDPHVPRLSQKRPDQAEEPGRQDDGNRPGHQSLRAEGCWKEGCDVSAEELTVEDDHE